MNEINGCAIHELRLILSKQRANINKIAGALHAQKCKDPKYVARQLCTDNHYES